MVVHIGRSILLSGQSTPSCCPRLLACLVVSCTGPHWPARLPPLSAGKPLLKFVISGADPTLFKKGCVNRFKALLLHVSPLSDSIFVLRNVASCLIPLPPLYMPTSLSSSSHQSPSHHLLTRNFWPMSPLQRTLFHTLSCSPEIGQLFLILGVHSKASAPCASVLFQAQIEGGVTMVWMLCRVCQVISLIMNNS